jgi:hypothetical protein
MAKSNQPRQSEADKARILANLPKDAERVQVTRSGKKMYVPPSEVGKLDQFVLKADGSPIVMKNPPGRKKKQALQAANDEIKEIIEARFTHIAENPLVETMEQNPEGDEVIDNILLGLAQEAAALEFERKEAERNGQDPSQISGRRARILKQAADVYHERKKLAASGHIDLEGPKFKAVFGLILDTFRQGMSDSGLRDEHIETIFTKVSKKIDDAWKAEAVARMKEAR